jgi:tetratricopeptide (TPR) repeat protein
MPGRCAKEVPTRRDQELAGSALSLRDQALAALDGGEPRVALALAEEALAALKAVHLLGGPDEAAVLVARAEIEEALDRFAAARTTIARAIALLGGQAGAGAQDGDCLLLWCQAHECLAGLERLAGDYDGAVARLTMVLDVASEFFGESSPAVVSAANSLGVVYKFAADFGAAEVAYQRALAAAGGMACADPLTKAGLLHNLGGLAHSRGDAQAGIPLAERGLALRLGALGPDHPDVARDNNALGALYHLAGRYRDADTAYRQALAVFENSFGPDHFEVAMTCANVAVLRADQERFAAAELLGRRALRIFEAVLGPGDAETGLTELNLATAVTGLGRRAEAARLATRAEATLAARLPVGHPQLAAARASREALTFLARAS